MKIFKRFIIPVTSLAFDPCTRRATELIVSDACNSTDRQPCQRWAIWMQFRLPLATEDQLCRIQSAKKKEQK